jgi:hypothetical protein
MTGTPARTMARARPAALQLHDVAAALLDEPDRGPHRLFVRYLIRAERQIAHHQRGLEPTPDGGTEHQHLVQRHGNRRRVTEDRHRTRVADEHHVDACGLGHLGAW